MTEPTIQSLTERLSRVERENCRLKRMGAMILIGIVGMVLMGQAVPKSRVVEAEQFILKDAGGNRRAELGLRGGAAGLYLYDEDEALRVTIEAKKTWSVLAFSKQPGKNQATLFAIGENVSLLLSDEMGGTARLATGDGLPHLSLYDKKGDATLKGGSLPNLTLADENHKPRAVIGHIALEVKGTGTVEQRPASSVVLSDRDGTVLWKAP